MRHNVDGRQFSRNTSHRLAMLKNLANSVILDEMVTTTVPKAKEVRSWVDRLVTLGKNGSMASRRLAFSRTRNSDVVSKLFSTLAQRYQNRQGGYTRILKMAMTRRGDGADMAVLELVDRPELNRSRADRGATGAQGKKSEKTEGVLDPLKKVKRAFSGKKGRAAKKAAGTESKGERSPQEAQEKKSSARKKKSTRTKGE